MPVVVPGRLVALLTLCAVLLPGHCSAGSVGSLIVCVESAKDLANLDQDEYKDEGGSSSDAFVAVLVGEYMFVTGVLTDTTRPQWHRCFNVPGSFGPESPVSFIVADADMIGNADDVIGTACTTASSGERWIGLTTTVAGQSESRGSLLVRTLLLTSEAAKAEVGKSALQFGTVLSEAVQPGAGAGEAATAAVRCPAGQQLAACQCWSTGKPGCAGARIESDADGEYCRAVAGPIESAGFLPPCGHNEHAAKQTPGVTCQGSGPPPPPAPIRASARCVAVPQGASITTVTSPMSRRSRGDAVEATCPAGSLAVGCSADALSPHRLGARFEEAADGTQACVAYAERDFAVRAQARCLQPAPAAAGGAVGVTIMAENLQAPFGETSAALRCPAPLQLSGCSCFSDNSNCLGAWIHPELAQFGGEAGDGSYDPAAAGQGMPLVCNASFTTPRVWWKAGAKAYGKCVHYGGAGDLIASAAGAPTTCPAPPGALPAALADKPWLPPNWRQKLTEAQAYASSNAADTDGDDDYDGRRYYRRGSGLVELVLLCLLGALLLTTIQRSIRARRLARMGGAPQGSPPQSVAISVGAPISGGTPPMTTAAPPPGATTALPVATTVAVTTDTRRAAARPQPAYEAPAPTPSSASCTMSSPLVASGSVASDALPSDEGPRSSSQV